MKNIDIAIKKTALDMNIPEDKAKVVVMGYWQEIYIKLLSGQRSAITVRHLGTFAMSRYKLNNYITKRVKKVKRVNKSVRLTDEQKEEIVTNEKKRLKLALHHRNDIATQYAENFGNI